jgi:hypothetical protein
MDFENAIIFQSNQQLWNGQFIIPILGEVDMVGIISRAKACSGKVKGGRRKKYSNEKVRNHAE